MLKKISQITLLMVLVSIFSFSNFFSLGNFTGKNFNKYVQADSIDKAEKELQAQLKQIEEEAAILEASLNVQKSKSATIERDVNVLDGEVKRSQLAIEKKNLEIRNLNSTIELKEQTISELDEKLERSRGDLALLIRKTNQADLVSLPEIILSNRNLTDFFIEFDSYKLAQNQLEKLFEDVRAIKDKTSNEKENLEIAQNKEQDAKAVIETEKRTVEIKKNEKDTLLTASKKSEATYASILAERRAQAATIRTTLFQLRDTAGIQFGDILKYAEIASKATGVRTALILGILKQETDLGKVDGSCLIVDLTSGKTKGINTGKIFEEGIHPTRDLPLIQNLVTKLGRNPLETRISCPWGNGYGGALGPSQFIPSTWQLYIPKLTEIFKTFPDPWNPQHAVMGTALLMKDNGAAAGGFTAERNAACKYYSGASCTPGRSPANVFYGDSVIKHAEDMQRQIDFLRDVDRD
jgi:membrane-bound lytic murein transglycosylase B